jgi:hypothetical protein
VYRNKTGGPQRISSLVLTVSDASGLAALTVTAGESGQSSTIAPVEPTSRVPFDPPIAIAAGEKVTFTLTARTANGLALIANQIVYASVLFGFDRVGLTSWALLWATFAAIVGMRRTRTKKKAALIGLIVLIVTLAGCGGGGGFVATGIRRTVGNDGLLNRPAKLSTIKVQTGSASISTIQSLTAFTFAPSSAASSVR